MIPQLTFYHADLTVYMVILIDIMCTDVYFESFSFVGVNVEG